VRDKPLRRAIRRDQLQAALYPPELRVLASRRLWRTIHRRSAPHRQPLWAARFSSGRDHKLESCGVRRLAYVSRAGERHVPASGERVLCCWCADQTRFHHRVRRKALIPRPLLATDFEREPTSRVREHFCTGLNTTAATRPKCSPAFRL
jgi:hypothetical protein